jgi:hypothetical protein
VAIIDDLFAIEAFIKARFPASTTGRQTIPEVPPPDSFYVRFLNDSRETETRYHYRADREYQIVYFAEWPEQIMPKMDTLASALYETEVVTDDMRVESFALSQPAKLDSGIYASIGILAVSVRQARIQPVVPLINHIEIKIN